MVGETQEEAVFAATHVEEAVLSAEVADRLDVAGTLRVAGAMLREAGAMLREAGATLREAGVEDLPDRNAVSNKTNIREI